MITWITDPLLSQLINTWDTWPIATLGSDIWLSSSVHPWLNALSSAEFNHLLANQWSANHLFANLPSAPTTHWILAQQFQQDVLGDLSKAFNEFVRTGRLWALLVGFVIGYIFKSLTSYG